MSGSESEGSNATSSEESESEIEPKILPRRETRGTRIAQLIGEEAEADESFWGQDAWVEEDDSDFVVEEELEDIIDDDFDLPEDLGEEIDEEKEVRNEERKAQRKRRSGKYVDPALKKSAVRVSSKEGVDALEAAAKGKSGDAEHSASASKGGARAKTKTEIEKSDRKVRRSTIAQSKETEERRRREERERAFKNSYMKPKKQITKKLTQEEMIAEAARTELFNQASLKRLQQIEEDKKKYHRKAQRVSGPSIRVHSKGEHTLVSFLGVEDFPPCVKQAAAPAPAKPLCVITGLPARYLDPLTKQPYANLDAFKTLRALYKTHPTAATVGANVAPSTPQTATPNPTQTLTPSPDPTAASGGENLSQNSIPLGHHAPAGVPSTHLTSQVAAASPPVDVVMVE